jgi:hypothetical protein
MVLRFGEWGVFCIAFLHAHSNQDVLEGLTNLDVQEGCLFVNVTCFALYFGTPIPTRVS